MPVARELGKQRRQYRGQTEPGLVCDAAGRLVGDSVDKFESVQGPEPGQAEGPLACHAKGPRRDTLPASGRHDPVAHRA